MEKIVIHFSYEEVRSRKYDKKEIPPMYELGECLGQRGCIDFRYRMLF